MPVCSVQTIRVSRRVFFYQHRVHQTFSKKRKGGGGSFSHLAVFDIHHLWQLLFAVTFDLVDLPTQRVFVVHPVGGKKKKRSSVR
jgi:hypothetical protein